MFIEIGVDGVVSQTSNVNDIFAEMDRLWEEELKEAHVAQCKRQRVNAWIKNVAESN